MPARESWIYEADGNYWTFMRGWHPQGFHYLEPLEAMWALGCPLIGNEVAELIEGIAWLVNLPKETWRVLTLSGLNRDTLLFQSLVACFAGDLQLGLGPTTVRQRADLSQGFEAYLARRSRQHRKSLRQSEMKVLEAGVRFESAPADDAGRLFERVLAVERRSWKGREGVGIHEGAMHEFYRSMIPSLHRSGALRLLFATCDGHDVGYILGAVMGTSYRGLQFSFDSKVRALGLGNVLQCRQMQALVREDVHCYDLGTEMDYKRKWADSTFETSTLLVLR